MNSNVSLDLVCGKDLFNQNAFTWEDGCKASEGSYPIMINSDVRIDVGGHIQGSECQGSGSVLIMAGSDDVEDNTSVLCEGVHVELAGGAPIEPTGMTRRYNKFGFVIFGVRQFPNAQDRRDGLM